MKKILRTSPHKRPRRVEGSPRPRFHAATKRVLQQMREAHAEVVAAFREAAQRLLAGDREVEFPEGTFPPGLAFVPVRETSVWSSLVAPRRVEGPQRTRSA